MIWIVGAAVALLAAAFVVWSLAARARPVAGADLAVYRAQLAEIDAERERGVLTGDAAAAARLEVERRLLKAAGRADDAPARPLGRGLFALLAAVALAAAVTLYLGLGQPFLPAAPASDASREEVKLGDTTMDMGSLVDKLIGFLAKEPEDLEGWGHLRRAAPAVGRQADYANALAAAVKARPHNGTLRALYAESLLMMDSGRPSAATRLAIAQALEVEPANPAARYYHGLILAEDGKTDEARQVWLALLADSPPDAPWRAQVVGRLQALEMAGLSDDDRQAAIRGMVEGLAARLEPKVEDRAGWARLAQAWTVLGETEKAAEAHAMAVKLAKEAGDEALLETLRTGAVSSR